MARAKEIEDDLRLVARTAKIIEKNNKNFRNSFIVPRSGLSYQELTESAAAFIADAPANKTLFDRYALKAQFFADLQNDLAEFRQITQGQADAQRSGVGANADTEAILKDTLDVREELDRALQNHYRDDPAKLAEWLTASHIERKRNRTADQTPPDETPAEETPAEETPADEDTPEQ